MPDDGSSPFTKSATSPLPAPRLKSRERRKIARLRKAAKRAKRTQAVSEPSIAPTRRRSIQVDLARPETWSKCMWTDNMKLVRAGLERWASGNEKRPWGWGDEAVGILRRRAQRELGWPVTDAPAPTPEAVRPGGGGADITGRRPPFVPGKVRRLHFAKGEAVPRWLEDTLVPGVFGADAVCVVGSIRRLRKMYLGAYPYAVRRDEPDREQYHMAPARRLEPGESLIRYVDALRLSQSTPEFQTLVRKEAFGHCSGGPESRAWLSIGHDLLFMVHYETKESRAEAFGDPVPGQRDEPVFSKEALQEIRFSRGEPVPNWMEDTSHSGVFEMDALCVLGSPALMLDRYSDLLAGKPLGPSDCERLIYISPVEPPVPGQALLRYVGAAISNRPFIQRDIRRYHWMRVITAGGPDISEHQTEGNDHVRALCCEPYSSAGVEPLSSEL